MNGFPIESVGLWILLAWFAIETYWDMRRSVILPIWLVLPPVVLGVIAQALYGEWLIAGAMAAAVLLHLSDRMPVRAVGTILLAGASWASGNIALAAGFGLFWILWETNIMGGADALAAYAALMVAPKATMFWSILAGVFLWAGVAMVLVYRGRLPGRIRLMVLRVLMRDLPREEEIAAEGKPTLGGLLLAVVLYLLWTGGISA